MEYPVDYRDVDYEELINYVKAYVPKPTNQHDLMVIFCMRFNVLPNQLYLYEMVKIIASLDKEIAKIAFIDEVALPPQIIAIKP